MAYTALMSLRTTLKDFALSSHISLFPTCEPIMILAFKAADSLRVTLQLLDGRSKSYSRKNVNALDERIKEAVWRFEDLLDSHVYVQIFPQSQILDVVEVHLDEIKCYIESFTKTMEEFKVKYMYELDHLCPEEELDVAVVSSATDSGVKNCKMVGSRYGYVLWNIRHRPELKPSLDVRSLVGMAGIGKTALAKKIFLDDEFQFECRAWVSIGRKWESQKLKRDILIQLDPCKGDERILKVKIYLIVMDDIWDYDVWDHFQRSFPKHIFGSTLVFLTTRLRYVADAVRPSRLYPVELLNDGESWDLLRQRVFGEEGSCPPELEKAGKEIAKECDGLPLMIVTIAELLCKHEKTVEFWESIAKKKNSPIFMTAYDRLYEVLFPSYEYLPQHFKPCFLYLGLFLQCEEVDRSWILDVWIAEGFILSFDNETMESSSEICLRGLFYHSVIICQRSINLDEKGSRKIKRCRLQSSFWHLCKREATNTKFSHVLSTLDDVEESMINTQRRLSFLNNILLSFNNLSHFVGDVCASTTRSLLFNLSFPDIHIQYQYVSI